MSSESKRWEIIFVVSARQLFEEMFSNLMIHVEILFEFKPSFTAFPSQMLVLIFFIFH